MTAAQLLVTVGCIGLIGVLARYFFRPQAAVLAEPGAGGHELTVVVRGGYQPNLIRACTGAALRLVLDRREDGDCSSRVVFAELSRFTGAHPDSTQRAAAVEDPPDKVSV